MNKNYQAEVASRASLEYSNEMAAALVVVVTAALVVAAVAKRQFPGPRSALQ